MNNIEKHKLLINELHSIFLEKNNKYGNSFSIQYKEFGPISALIRITDKYLRLKGLILNNQLNNNETDESLTDTLKDLANYCILTAIEIDNKKEEIDVRN